MHDQAIARAPVVPAADVLEAGDAPAPVPDPLLDVAALEMDRYRMTQEIRRVQVRSRAEHVELVGKEHRQPLAALH